MSESITYSLGKSIAKGMSVVMLASLAGSVPPSQAIESSYNTCLTNPDGHNGNRPFVDLVPYATPHPRTWDGQKSSRLTLHKKEYGHVAETDTRLSQSVESKVAGAVVKITFEDKSGTGFISTDKYGNRVVVTAAHVARPDKIAELRITDLNGHTTRPTGGCYVYGGVKPVPGVDINPAEQVDVAVLQMEDQIGTSTLSIAEKTPPRGSEVHFYNFQQQRAVHDPAQYGGIVLNQQSTMMDDMVLTGVAEEWDASHLEQTAWPGASGGPEVTASGEVAFMSVSSISIDKGDLLHTCGVVVNGPLGDNEEYSHGVVAGSVDADTIRTVIAQGAY
jgi:hypothetical protein